MMPTINGSSPEYWIGSSHLWVHRCGTSRVCSDMLTDSHSNSGNASRTATGAPEEHCPTTGGGPHDGWTQQDWSSFRRNPTFPSVSSTTAAICCVSECHRNWNEWKLGSEVRS